MARSRSFSHLALQLSYLLALAVLSAGGLRGVVPVQATVVSAGAKIAFTSIPIYSSNDYSSIMALGDVDGDLDLDLVIGKFGTPNELYLNNGTALPWAGVNGLPIGTGDHTTSIALGDVDGDGDLDLVVGVDGFFSEVPNQLYLNNGTVQPWAGVSGISIGPVVRTHSIALGDVDSDGDLDLVTNYQEQSDQFYLNSLYLNNGTAHPWANVSGMPIGPADNTVSIALGDVDNDGDLDLVAGNYAQPDQLYLNNGTALPWAGVNGLPIGTGDHTRSIALGDVDGDGDLDLVVGVDGFLSEVPNQLYLNNGTVQPWAGVSGIPIGPAYNTVSIALGDIDDDGDLDLVTGNFGHPDRLYLNNIISQRWANTSVIAYSSPYSVSAIVLGDIDGDSDVDLIIGNYQATKLYLNDGSTQPWADTDGIPIEKKGPTSSLAVGDVDNDGDLDLVTGTADFDVTTQSYGGPVKLYFNNGTAHPWDGVAGIPIGSVDVTSALALGDVDGDGDLDLVRSNYGIDLVTGVYGEQDHLYLNNGTAHPWDGVAGIPIGSVDITSAIALGDVDGDGDLDLVTGNDGQPNQLYLNNGSAQPWADVKGYPIGGSDRTYAIALGDVDSDGDLDLVAGKSSGPSQLYLNNGTALPWVGVNGIPIDQSTGTTYAIALEDVDGDSDLDIVTIGEDELSTTLLHYNTLHKTSKQINHFPRLTLQHSKHSLFFLPIIAQNAPFSRSSNTQLIQPLPSLTAPEQRLTQADPTVTIPYILSDAEGDAVREVRAFYSLNGGGQWLPAIAATGTITRDLAAAPWGTPHTFTWDLAASSVFGRSDNTVVRLIAIPSLRPTRGQVAGPFQRAYSSTTTPPFSVRGAQVRVLQDGRPVNSAIVYRLSPGQARNAQPIPPQRAGHPQLRTDHLGYLQGRAQFAAGDQLVALAPISSTTTYTMYLTSAHPTATGLGATAISGYGDQTLTVSRSNPLILFNLSVALEWDARADSAFVRQLETDIKRASELLFRWSGGQAALGDITVYNNREHWDDAHIRIYATNRLRPNAIKGGIVDDTLPDPNPGAESYRPGQLRMGSVWNRYGDSTANLGDDWARALAHEIGHFALFLDDNYLGLDQQKRLISVGDCPGAMTDPYRDDFGTFHPDADWLPGCAQTLSQVETGRSDWATIKTFYDRPELGFVLNAPPAFAPEQNPALLPLEITHVRFQGLDSAGADPPLEAPVVVLTTETGQQLLAGAGARGFVFQENRLLDVGKPNLDQLLARGARPGDRVCVYELDHQRLGCRAITASYQALPLTEHSDWQPDISVTPVNSTTLDLQVGNLPPGQVLRAQLYPTNGVGQASVLLTETNGSYHADLTSPVRAPAFEGYVHIWVDEPEPRRETVIDFLLGGNPGLKIGRGTPRGSPGLKIGRGAPVISSDGQALLFNDAPLAAGQFFALQATSSPPAPPSWATPVGRAYRLTNSPGVSLAGSSINIGYLGDEVLRGQEAGIQVFFWDAAQQRWTALTTRLDQQRNEASASISQPGFYALMTSIYVPLANAGWNLVYFYPGATQPITDALAGIDGHYTSVYGYDSTDSNDPWKLYDVAVPIWVNELSLLQYGHGYWISATEPITVPVRGGTPNSQRVSVSGPGILAAPPATYYGTLQPSASFIPTAGLPVTATIDGVACGQAQTRLVDGQVVLAIDVLSAASQPGCGAPGQTVTITIGSLSFIVTWDNGRPHALV